MVGVGVFYSVSGVSRVKLTSAQFPNNCPTELRMGAVLLTSQCDHIGWLANVQITQKLFKARLPSVASLPPRSTLDGGREKVEETLVAEQVARLNVGGKAGRDHSSY